MMGWLRKVFAPVWWMTDQQRDNTMLVVYLLVIASGAIGIGASLHHNSIILGAGSLLITSAGVVLFVARWTLQSRERRQPGWGGLAQPLGPAEGIMAVPPSELLADSGAAAPPQATGQPAT
jgi:hypothetical protein